MATEVILTGEVENLGGQGEAVKVADGYARNFLLPRGLAILATPGNLKRIEALRKRREAELAAKREEAQKLAEKLAKIVCTISVPVGADGKLFGAVTTADIAVQLKAQGVEVDRKKVVLEHPLRQIGETEVEVRLQPEVVAKIKVNVVAGAADTKAHTAAPAEAATAPTRPATRKPKDKDKAKAK